MQKVVVWGSGVATIPCTKKEGVAAKLSKLPNFLFFFIFSFCHNKDYINEILEK